MSDSLGPRPYDFMPGYTNNAETKYMNVGYVSSPYPGKTGHGDYGPLQGGGIYYTPLNPTYPYPMDFSATRPPWEIPSLAYAQDIPIRLRREDIAIHGLSEPSPTPEQSSMLYRMSNNSRGCGK